MIQLHKGLMLGLIILAPLALYGVKRTVAVAVEMDYPDLIIGLRNEANELLADKKAGMKAHIADLRKKDLELRADELSTQYLERYLDLEEDIDETFMAISEEFIAGANELDEDEASVSQKKEFIGQMSEYAQQEVTNMLTKNGANTIKETPKS